MTTHMGYMSMGHELSCQHNEQRTYGEREEVPDMAPCMKRPIVIHAKQMQEAFRVKSMEGDYKQGKPGDYLMRGIAGELYICDREIFEASYGWVTA